MRKSCCPPTPRQSLQTAPPSGTVSSRSRKPGTASWPARSKRPCPANCPGNSSLPLVRAYVKDNFVDKGMCAPTSHPRQGNRQPPCSYHADRPAPERKWRMGRKVPQGIRPGREQPSVSRMGKAAGRTTGRTPPTGTTKGMWRFGGRHGRPIPTGHWRPPVSPPW